MEKEKLTELRSLYQEFVSYQNNCEPFEKELIQKSIARIKDLISPYIFKKTDLNLK